MSKSKRKSTVLRLVQCQIDSHREFDLYDEWGDIRQIVLNEARTLGFALDDVTENPFLAMTPIPLYEGLYKFIEEGV